MDDIQIDDVDRSILHQLQLNARQTDTEIAEKVDVTSTTVRNRLDKLEDGGVIRGYHPEINYEEAGYPLHVMFVCTVNPNKLESMAEQILDVRGVVTTRDLLGGERNVHIEVVADTVREIEEIRNDLADLGLTINSSEIISETRVQSWDHFYPRPPPTRARTTPTMARSPIKNSRELIENLKSTRVYSALAHILASIYLPITDLG
ncbi:Lrp/AsnC family transcriptional regulator [Halorubrum sp. CBA1125]|uniref:Lrp/AsnC family transcriptional regulator n=1 Tax=Halorubrum sp. CBA1125 TaxID=2668072 RepID=UPI0018D262FA|nr:Lrp/AsnC family transcriptional regulator [Halorubrum sp. CBA1125]